MTVRRNPGGEEGDHCAGEEGKVNRLIGSISMKIGRTGDSGPPSVDDEN